MVQVSAAIIREHVESATVRLVMNAFGTYTTPMFTFSVYECILHSNED